MAYKNLEFKVGLFVVIGAVILAGSLYWLQGFRLQRDTQVVEVIFDDVGMLKVGNIVTVSGMFKGKVNRMDLTEQGVVVEFLLAGDVILKEDAQFIIRNYGLMGERFVAVFPGESEAPLDLTVPARGRYDSGLPQVMGLMGEMVTELHDLVIAFRNSVASDSTLTKFNHTVSNLESVSSSMAEYLKRNEAKLDRTADNFLRASRELNGVLARNAAKVDSSAVRMDRLTLNLEEFVIKLDTLSMSARQFADKLNNPDGTLQLMLEDRRLYDDLRRTADDIDDLVKDIKADPRKYINLKLEIF